MEHTARMSWLYFDGVEMRLVVASQSYIAIIDTLCLISMYAYVGGKTYLKGLTDAEEQPTKNINFVTQGITYT